jgi:hypothetical protein
MLGIFLEEEHNHTRMMDHGLSFYNQEIKSCSNDKMLASHKEVDDFLVAAQLKFDAFKKTGMIESDNEESIERIGMIVMIGSMVTVIWQVETGRKRLKASTNWCKIVK